MEKSVEKKNRELMNATVILSSISLGLAIFGAVIVFILFVGISLIAVDEFGYSNAMAELGFSGVFVSIYAFIIIAALVLKIITFIFVRKSKRENSSSYVLTAAILNAVGVLSSDPICIASSVCGFILYAKMIKEDKPAMEATVNNEYQDNIYGMK